MLSSFGIPFALIPVVLLTRNRSVMGALVDRPVTTTATAAVIVCFNVFLIADQLVG